MGGPKTVRIVLAEPDSIHRSHFQNIVAHSRYELVHSSATVAPIFDALRNLTPDVLVLDVVLAGSDVVPTIRRGFPDVRVLLSYEPLHADAVLPGLAGGAHDAVKKPFQGSELFDSLFHAVARQSVQAESEQRTAGRVRMELEALGSASSGGFLGRSLSGKVGDFSEGGLCLRTEDSLEPGERVRLRIQLPDGELKVKARVANSRAGEGKKLREYGLEFRGLSRRQRRKIETFLLEHLSGIPEAERREEGDGR